MTTSANHLKRWLPELGDDNAQSEYYLTDIVKMAVKEGYSVTGILAPCPEEVRGVNNLCELANLERFYQRQKANEFMLQGVTIIDPNRFDIRGKAVLANDVVIDINVILEGDVSIGANSFIGPNTLLRNVKIGENVQIEGNCVIQDSVLENNSVIGPFVHIRPGTVIGKNARVGNFVEIKNSQLGEKSKVPHLSYIGDANIGTNVNVGAGTITVNYDGTHKHKTIIDNGAFIGCGSQLIAPITIGEGAYIAAGSTLTSDAPPHQLTLARVKQRSIESWKKKK